MTHTQARRSRPVRWGYLQQTVARHGVATSRLVVYPPNSSETERRWAQRFYGFAPIALGGGTSCWLLLIALGVSPEVSAIALLSIIAPVGSYLWWRSSQLRSRTIVLWSNRSGLWPHPDDEEREQTLTTLSSVMQAACADARRGAITGEAFERIWISVYVDAGRARSARRTSTPLRDATDAR